MRSTRALPIVSCVLFALTTRCAPPPSRPQDLRTLTVVVAGDEHRAELVGDAIEHAPDLPVRIRRAALPGAPPAPQALDAVSAGLARARREYIDADFTACLGHVADDARVNELLAAGRRDLAGRVLFWRTACQVGAGDAAEAPRAAHRLAVFGLDVPSDVEAAAPEVEAVIAAAQREVAASSRTEVRLSADSPTATFALD
ncbi:MAG: hypothetical protein WCJ30_04080, partial [Deltaproteobacteria bacterium]